MPVRNYMSKYYDGTWVYYKTLPQYYPELANTVDVRFMAEIEATSKLATISAQFESMAAGELTKEMALINEKFGGNIQGSYKDQDFAKRLIEAINTCLGIKKIFERNLALIQESSGGQKNVMSYFPTYFEFVWQQHAQEIYNSVATTYIGSSTSDLADILAAEVNKRLPELVKEAIIKMFDAQVEGGIKKDREKYEDAYSQMRDAVVNNKSGANEFIDAFIQNYHLMDIVDIIKNEVVKAEEIKDIIGKKNAPVNIHANIQQRGGLTMEDVRTMIFNMILGGMYGGSDSIRCTPEGGALKTGDTKMKPDIIATVGIPLDAVSNWLRENTFGDRDKNVKAAQQLSEQLNKFNDGFIVYTNAKNYTLNTGFEKRGGFSAGSPISLETFGSIMSIVGINADVMIRNCLQLIPGAIGEDKMAEAQTMMASAIATALFDDFDTIGTVPQNSGKAIHLLDLNGVLIPLSFYLFLLSDAFSEAASLPVDQVVQANITTPAGVMFSEPAPYGMSEIYWNTQRKEAMSGISISWHFLSGFKSIMQQLL